MIFRYTALVLLLLVMTGCGGGIQRVAVEGEVSLDGKPIQKGSILFRPTGTTKGMTAGGEIIDGRYQLSADKGPVVGNNIVEFYADFKTGRKVLLVPHDPGSGSVDEYVQVFPERFNTRSTVQCEIKSGESTYDFNLRLNQ